MTACIVGWAHTPFGKLTGETVEKPHCSKWRARRLTVPGSKPRDVDEIVLGHFNAGFSAQDFTASLVLQASPDLRFKRATRVENACATGSAAVHQGLKSIAAESDALVLVVGVEQMTTRRPSEIGRNLLKASYVARKPTSGWLRRGFRPDCRGLFPALGRPVRCARANRRQEPQERRWNPYAQIRKDLGYEFCRTESDKIRRRGAAQAHRLLTRSPTARPLWSSPMSRRR